MTETKKWWQSKTLWGIIIAVVGILLKQFGVDAPELPANADATQLEAYYAAIKAANGSVTAITSIVLEAVGTLWAIYGRIKADQKIGS